MTLVARCLALIASGSSRSTSRTEHRYTPRLERLEDRLPCDDASADNYSGIHARGLEIPMSGGTVLTGWGIPIGQIEKGRPGKPLVEPVANSHPDVKTHAIFRRNGPPVLADTLLFGGHGTRVAGVMIADGRSQQWNCAESRSLGFCSCTKRKPRAEV